MAWLAAIALAAAFVGGPQDQDRPTSLPDVVVNASPRTAEAARQFVETVAVTPVRATSIATWKGPICLQIENLSPAVTSIMAAQIEAHALNLGVRVAPPGCRPNVMVLATADGAATAAAMVEAGRSSFLRSSGPTQLSRDALQRFVESGAAVRWWNTSAPYDVNNELITVPIDGQSAPLFRILNGVSFGESEVQSLLSAYVVIDARKTGDIPVTVLADFIAFVILAEVDATQDFSAFPSILNLFSGASPDGMTNWDYRYLNALYLAPVQALNTRYQLAEIARLMASPNPPRVREGRR